MATFITEEKLLKGRGDVRDFILFSEENLNAQSPTPEEYFLISLAADIALGVKRYALEKKIKTGRITVDCQLKKDRENPIWIQKKISYEYVQEEEIEKLLEEQSRNSEMARMISIPIKYVD